MLAPQGKKRVAVAHISKGVNRDRGDVQLAAKRPLIQRLNVFEPMLEAITAQVDLVFRHRVKHEGVVRIGRMAQGEDVRFGRHGGTLTARGTIRKTQCRHPERSRGTPLHVERFSSGSSTPLGMTPMLFAYAN